MRRVGKPLRIGMMGIAVALSSAALTGPATAHAHLVAASPADGATIAAAPAELDLAFSEVVNPGYSGASMTGLGGLAVPLGKARSGAAGGRTLVLPVNGPLAPGAYRVDWHALAADGHKTTGSYGFTVAP